MGWVSNLYLLSLRFHLKLYTYVTINKQITYIHTIVLKQFRMNSQILIAEQTRSTILRQPFDSKYGSKNKGGCGVNPKY